MFIGRPPGNYDRLLDFSRAVTGALFFVPAATFLERIASGEIPASHTAGPDATQRTRPGPLTREGTLGIGTLKGKPQL
jgi:putative iron-dependent peroxidase